MAPNPGPGENRLRVVHAAAPRESPQRSLGPPLEDVFSNIGERLSRLLGPDGYRALVERALEIATEDYPLLKTVRPAIAPVGRLVGLPRLDEPDQRDQVFEALGGTLAVLFALLEQLLGSDLVCQLLGFASTELADGVLAYPTPERDGIAIA
jgi:hypothetical protein